METIMVSGEDILAALDAHENLVGQALICPRSAPSQGAKLSTDQAWYLAYILTEITSSCHYLAMT